MSDKFNDVKSVHYKLMTEYVNIIDHTSKIPFSTKSRLLSDNSFETFVFEGELKHFAKLLRLTKFSGFYGLRFLIKLFVESHIHGKLKELGNIYIQLSQTISTDDEYQKWLIKTEEGTIKFANTLTSIQSIRGLASVFLPWISGVTIAILGSINIQQFFKLIFPISNQALMIGLVLFISLIYFDMFILGSFIYKRNLFYKSGGFVIEFLNSFFNLLPGQKEMIQLENSFENIYQIEDELFAILSKRKTREKPIDMITFSLVFFIVGFCCILEPIYGHGILSNFVAVIAFLMGFLFILGGFKRKWR